MHNCLRFMCVQMICTKGKVTIELLQNVGIINNPYQHNCKCDINS